MKKLLILFLALGVGKAFAEDTQFHGQVYRSSQIAADKGVYNNVLLSSANLVFHVLNGSGTVNQSSSYFVLFWSTSNPPASDMSTKAFVPLNYSPVENAGLGYAWDVPVLSTGSNVPVYTFYSKQGGAGPLFIEYQTYKYPAPGGSATDKFWKD